MFLYLCNGIKQQSNNKIMKTKINVTAKELQDYLIAKMNKEWSLEKCELSIILAVKRLGDSATKGRIIKEATNFLYA